MIGSVLDKYEVLQKLGEGATATVYRGRHLTIGRDVAIKVLHPHLSASSRYRERFNREARAVGRLSHQNIVSILDYSGQNAEECYIVTELIDGVTVLELIQQRGRLPSEIAALIGAALASALAFAHREGIIHRDIKPENVMIRRDGRVKLMDFGVARVLDESSITLDGSLLGSPAYMSPQQALDETLDGRTDIFSLGTVLFHAVTGHVPFSGSNASVILRNIIEANRPDVLELAPQASPSIAAVIDRLLQPRPDDRYPTADDASAALLACLDEVGLSPEHPTINLRAYVVDAVACEESLATILRPTLLQVGKDRLTRGDTLGALQLFNRLLAIDEDNAEVIALIQSLHQAAPGASWRTRAPLPALILVVLGLLLGGGAWVWTHRDSTSQVDSSPAAPVAITAPAVTAPPPGTATTASGPAVVSPPPDGALVPALTPPSPPRASPGSMVPVRIPEGARKAMTLTLPAPAAVKPAEVVFNLKEAGNAYCDVWVDGVKHGARRDSNPAEAWIGTEGRPLKLPPGKYQIEVRNPYADPWKTDIQLSEGEPITLTPVLRRKQVEFTVNPLIPDGCKLTVGTTVYDPVRTFRTINLRDPDPATLATFECPSPIGSFSVTLGETVPGGTVMLPTRVPNTRGTSLPVNP
ncbi:MAG: protein kinase [Pseudomonadota bacterium]|nr:protein kinase [Pseudomonadota bacterium]